MRLTVLQNVWEPTYRSTLEAVKTEIDSAGALGTDFILLPEHFLGPPSSGGLDSALAEETLTVLRGLAKKYRSYVITGSWLECEGTQFYNVSHLLNRDGDIQYTLRKPFSGDGNDTGSDFPVISTDFGKVAILLGNDFWLIEPPRIQSLQGAEILFVPGTINRKNQASKASAIWGVATLNCMAIAYASAVGFGDNAPCGNSMVVLPNKILHEAKKERETICVRLQEEQMKQMRQADLTFKNTLWFGLWARRKELYAPLVETWPLRGR